MLSIGSYTKDINFSRDTGKVEKAIWISSKHNMGMTFNRNLWKDIKRCTKTFCLYDDYNWDWSLQKVSMACFPEELTTMVLRGPRVFHIGECGVHHKKSCKSTSAIRKTQRILQDAAPWLFPKSFSTVSVTYKRKIPKKDN